MNVWKYMTVSTMGGTGDIIKVTEKGMAQLNLYQVEWKNYSRKIQEIFEGGVTG